MKLLKKECFPDLCPILYDRPFTRESFAEDFEVCGGHWYVEDGWLIGENRGNFPGMAISRGVGTACSCCAAPRRTTAAPSFRSGR